MSPQPETQKKAGQSRRDFLRKVGVGSATAAGVSAGAIRLNHGPVQNSQAIAPAIAAAGVGASMAAGWALREYEVIGSNPPPEGLTPDGLASNTRSVVRTRQSTNQSTFVDNKNIISNLEHTAYGDAKIAALDILNEGGDQQTAQDAAVSELNEQETTIIKNLLRSHTETMQEVHSASQTIQSHEDLGLFDVFYGVHTEDNSGGQFGGAESAPYDYRMESFDLPNGETLNYAVLTIKWRLRESDTGDVTDEGEFEYDVLDNSYRTTVSGRGENEFGSTDDYYADIHHTAKVDISDRYEDRDDVTSQLVEHEEWHEIITDAQQTFDDVRDGIILWINEAYNALEAGDVDTTDLLTPREMAQITADDEDYPQAISDLQALNIGVDLEREAEILFPEIEATAYGQISYSGDSTLSTGLVDPDQKDGTIYFTYDVSQGSGTWSAYQEEITGGELTITADPFDDTIYAVETTDDETVQLTESDFSEDGDNWVASLSLETPETTVDQIEYFAQAEQTQYDTIRLQDEFEIITFRDSEGQEYDQTEFVKTEPQTDDNYITEEEWQEQQERHEELIEKYEDAQGGGAITIGGASIPTELVGLGLAVAAAIGLLR